MTKSPSDLREIEAQIDHYLRLAKTDSSMLGQLMMSLMGSAIAIAEGLGLDPDAQWRRLRVAIDESKGPLS